MVWQMTPWADPLLVSTVVAATLAVFGLLYVLLVRHDRRVVAFATVMIGTAVWTLGYSFQFASAELADKRLWATVAMVGQAVVPVAWCTFALVYVRRDKWLTPVRLAALWTIPALTVVLAATNGQHNLVWRTTAIELAPGGGYTVLVETAGPWMLIHGGYSYLVAFVGMILIIRLIGRTRRIYRGQAAVLLAGIMVPAAANLASLTGLGPAETVDMTPPSMTVLGVAFAVGIFKYRLFDLVPVARSSVVENMGEGYVLLDETDEIVDFNTAARSLLAGDGGRLLGRSARSAFGADLSVLDSFSGDPITETVAVAEGADERYIDLTVSRVEAGRVTGRLVVVRDVTDRIRLEQRFRRLIEASSDIVFVLDETGEIDYASPSVERILGYDPDTLVGDRSFEELVATEADVSETDSARSTRAPAAPERPRDGTDGQGSTAASTWRRVLEGRGRNEDPESSSRIRFEIRLRTAGGETRTIEAIARYLIDDPVVEGIVINARDVTERVRRERELARTNERLDQFVSFVSHDLRNPLNVAMGHLDLAMETGDEDSLETVGQQHERMETMIEDLLSMAREGEDVEETTPVDLGPVATRAWESVQTDGASLVVADDVTVMADASRLPNLFENLFRNAIEHGATDPSSLTVRVEASEDGFAVSDDGVGIPEQMCEEVTESGYTTEGSNTGYGLAIVSEIATAHGWDLSVGESDNSGARFVFADVDVPADTDGELGADRSDADQGTTDQRADVDGGLTEDQATQGGK